MRDILLSLRGQSAIEYLMTYGWMLLVVAVVGGAVFSVVQSESVSTVSGFTGSEVQIDNFGATQEENLQLAVRNTDSNSVKINSVNITSNSDHSEWIGGEKIGVSDTKVIELAGVVEGDAADSLDININYDSGGLSNLEASGTISGSLQVKEGSTTTLAKAPENTGQILDNMAGSGTSSDPYQLTNIYELQAIQEDLDAYYVLNNNIDGLGTKYWNNEEGFNPLGQFSGTLDGQGFVIKHLVIKNPNDDGGLGLISDSSSGSIIENIGVVNADVEGGAGAIGILVGRSRGEVVNSFSTGEVKANEATCADGCGVGGLIGESSGRVATSFSSATVRELGQNSHSAGGLVARARSEVINSYSTGKVIGIENSRSVGGLIGQSSSSGGEIRKSFTYGDANIDGSDSGVNFGGVVGENNYVVEENVYWDFTKNSDLSQSDGIGDDNNSTGFETGEMQGVQAEQNMADLDFDNIWDTVNDDYPVLQTIDRDTQLEFR